MKNIEVNSWIEYPFAYKKAPIAKQIQHALEQALPKYGGVFVLIRVGDDGEITKKEQKDIGIPVQIGVKGVRKGSIQLVLKDGIIKRGDLEHDNR